MKRLLMLVFLAPLSSFAQYPNPQNNPNLPGYQIPSQQRLQTQMGQQQQLQQNQLSQQLQQQSQQQQRQLNTEINNNTQRLLPSPQGQKNGPVLNQSEESGSSLLTPPPATTP